MSLDLPVSNQPVLSSVSNGKQFEKAQAFVNLYLPSSTAPSGRVKVGAVALKASDPDHKHIIEFLMADEEVGKAPTTEQAARLELFKNQFIMDFQLTKPNRTTSGLTLGVES